MSKTCVLSTGLQQAWLQWEGSAGSWGSTDSLWFCLCFVFATSENMGEGTVEKLVRI